MKKLHIVKKNQEFEDIIKNGTCKKNKYYVIYSKKNDFPYDRYGISVSKKLGNAVFRNKYKRKLRAIVDKYKKSYIHGQDNIILLRKEATNKSYQQLEMQFIALMEENRKEIKK